jgi:hypothetical protein
LGVGIIQHFFLYYFCPAPCGPEEKHHRIIMATVRGGQIINIAGLVPVDDPEYRYKMPAVFGKIEGSGNGIKVRGPMLPAVGHIVGPSHGLFSS